MTSRKYLGLKIHAAAIGFGVVSAFFVADMAGHNAAQAQGDKPKTMLCDTDPDVAKTEGAEIVQCPKPRI